MSADMSDDDFRAKADAYLKDAVAKGANRDEVLNSFSKSGDARLQAFAKAQAEALNPPTRGAPGDLSPPTKPMSEMGANMAASIPPGVLEYAPYALGAGAAYLGAKGVGAGLQAYQGYRAMKQAEQLHNLDVQERTLRIQQLQNSLPQGQAGTAVSPFNPVAEPIVKADAAVNAAETLDRAAIAQQRIEQGKAMGLGAKPPAVPVAPAAPGVAPAPVVTADPTATGTQVAESVVREELNAPKAAVAPKPEGVSGRVRRTQAQIAEAAAEAAAKAPPGMIPSAPAKTNKMPGDVIGQGGWHWFSGQGGTPEEWLRVYGRTNQPYSRVVADVKGGVISVPPPPEGSKGGRIPRGEYVPEYIKGQASIPGMVSAGLNALGALGLLQAYKQGKETGDYSDFGLGAIGQVLGNIAPKAGMGFSLMAPATLNAGEQEELAKRRKKPATMD